MVELSWVFYNRHGLIAKRIGSCCAGNQIIGLDQYKLCIRINMI